jgi:type IV pilus assembly protein PilO
MALLPTDPKKQKQVIIGLVPIVLLVAYYQFMYTPRVTEIETLDGQLATLTSGNDAGKQALVRYGPNLAGRIAIFEEHITKLEELIPRRQDVPELMNQVTEQAGLHGVEIVEFNPGDELPGEFYGQQSYGLSVIGDYHSIGEYLTSIGSLARIARPLDLKLNIESQRPATREGVPMLRAAFRVETFVMPDPAEVKAKADSVAAAAAAAAAAATPPVPVTTGGVDAP